MTLLSINHLHFSRHSKTVLDVERWQLEAGHFVGVLGPNGAGKSTFLKLIAGEWHGSGSVLLHGRALKQWQRQELACHLAVLPQSSQLSLPFTAREVVALGAIPLTANRQTCHALVEDAMQRTHATQLADALFVELSGGEQQRVQLARVLVQLAQAKQPPLLLLDEPISAQDLAQQHAVMQLVRQLAHEQGWGILAVLHDINFAVRYCDQLCLLGSGQLVGQGVSQQCINADTVEKLWGYRPQQLAADDGTAVFC